MNFIDSLEALFSLKGLTPFQIAAQVVGYVGLVFNVITFQCKKHRNLMIFKTANELLFGAQYILLGAFTGAMMNFVSAVRNTTFAVCVEKKKSTLVFQIMFSLFFIVSGILTWQGYLSLLIIAAKVVTTVAYSIKNTRIIRFLTFPTSICWLIYNYTSGSAAGVLCEVLTLISILVAIARFDLVALFAKKDTTSAKIKEDA